MNHSVTHDERRKQSDFGLFCLLHGDRLGSLLGRIAIAAPLPAALFAAMTGFSAAIVASLEGSFFNQNLSLDLASDIGWWNQFVLAFGTLVYIAGAYFGSFPKTLRQLTDSGVLQASDAEWKTVRRFTTARLSNRSIVLVPYVCGMSAALLSVFVIQSSGTWFDASRYSAGWLIPIHSFFLFYLLTYLTLRLYFAYLILKMLFSFKVNIQPFHTDGCGGLGGLKTQSGKLYLGMLVFGVIAALGVISNTVNYGQEILSLFNVIMLAAYVLLTSVAFFLPLYATSASMREAQQQFVVAINERYRLLQRKSGNDLVGKGSNEDIIALETLKATARSMQVWPFNSTGILKFLGSVASPFLVIALYLLLGT